MQNALVFSRELLKSYLADRVSLTSEEQDIIFSYYELQHIPKKAFLFEQGSHNVRECFVTKGTMRVFYTDEKAIEHVLYFAFAEWWVGDMASMLTGDMCSLSVQALDDCTILSIGPEQKEELLEKVPKLERLFRMMLQKHLSVFQRRFLMTLNSSASERYEELLKRSPGIERLVPQHQIASYLGIMPESLSRMKKQLLRR
jgi:CRP-like cAMP-binding protein